MTAVDRQQKPPAPSASRDLKAEKKATQAAEAAKAMAEYQAKQVAIDANTERLRALRLAKEAREAAKPQPSKGGAKRK